MVHCLVLVVSVKKQGKVALDPAVRVKCGGSGVTMRVYCRLAEIMRARRVRVKDLHRVSGVGRESIAALRGNTWERVSRDVIARLCGALDITLDELFVLYDSDIWFPIRLHRELTIHCGSNCMPPSRGGRGRGGGQTWRRPVVGAWDFRAMRLIWEHLNKLGRDITIRLQEHAAGLDSVFDTGVGRAVAEVLSSGNHLIIGSPISNPFTEVALCRLFGVAPYTPGNRDKFPYGFVWDSGRTTASSFGWQGVGKEFGIAETRSGRLVARRTLVPHGEGIDCALLVTYRIRPAPVQRRYGRDDERIIIFILGDGGPGTQAGAEVATNRKYAEALTPSAPCVPLMRIATAKYMRPATDGDLDNRFVTHATLLAEG